MNKESSFPISIPYLLSLLFLMAILGGAKWNLNIVLIYVYPMAKDVELSLNVSPVGCLIYPLIDALLCGTKDN